ncbi:MAG: threonine--tRNA ligase [Spirochaetota bacterium]|nr:threonine--tRNA ligase [Spirochaetota bacterium]
MSDQIQIALPDSSIMTVSDGLSVYHITGKIGQGLQKQALVARINDNLVDLSFIVDSDASIDVLTFDSEEGRDAFWHSSSHLMAQAVKRIFPDAKLAIGPAIENGFYYDFDVKRAFIPEDLDKIEAEMKRINEEDLAISREELSKAEAIDLFKSLNEPYKVELIEEMEGDAVTVYRQGEFVDLCRGPHLLRTSYIKTFKLLSIAGAYWRGDEKNKMLQRIYGVAFPDKKRLKKHLDLLEEAKKRDHRKLGKELDLFSFSNDVGTGLPLWHPNGAVLRFIIDKFETNEHLKRGYKLFNVPHIARANLYQTSGHLDFYSENMYSPIQIDEQDYYLKPMNCPSQIQIYTNSIKSYRDMPYKCFEMGTVYRYERSGVLHGLTRVRGFTVDDAHIFCTEDQVEDEIMEVMDFTFYMLSIFGFDKRNVYLSTEPEKSVGSEANWELATTALKSALEKNNISYSIDPGAGVFYGPKIDIKIRDALGREWQCSTIQVDFNLPERFDLSYIGQDGRKHRPIMIHRALLGSLERFIGILIEHYAGKFPVWLAPVQIMLLNVNEEQKDFTYNLNKRMLSEEIRADSDLRDESITYKVRDAISKKIPYIGVIGNRELEAGTISLRVRGENNSSSIDTEELINKIKEESKGRI